MVYGIYGIGKMDAAYRVMNIANAQMAMMNSLGPNADMARVHQMDNQLALDSEKAKFNYKMLDKLDQMNKKIVEEKFKDK